MEPQMTSQAPHISRGKLTQDFSIGATVKIGFMSNLRVLAVEETPGDFRPDCYILQAASGTKYRFQPHYGLERL